MRYLIVICCVLMSTLAVKNQKISLEDIERDNLKLNKFPRTPVPQKTSTDFGFVATKTATDYARQQPKEHYVQPQYVPAQQYVPPPQQYLPQQYLTVPQQYYAPVQQQNQYQQYENVQYVTDNSIATQQQYYTPQYIYYQQHSAPSTAVQTVVDPKGAVQYVMYIPTYTGKEEQTQNYEDIVYATPQSQEYSAESVPQQVVPSVQHADPKTRYFTSKHEPRSLLESYVPSILQVQYYKQQQKAQSNAIKETLKPVGKIEYAKNYRDTVVHGAETVVDYNYQIPSAYHK